MKNPVYIEYRRSMVIGILLLLVLSGFGAVVHYIRSIDATVLQNKVRLAAVGNQLDSEFGPVLAFMEAVRRAALLKLNIPPLETDTTLPILQLKDGLADVGVIMDSAGNTNTEMLLLLRLQPYFELAQETQPHLVGMYYVSEQGFAYNGLPKWSDYVADHLLQWRRDNMSEPNYERGQVFYPEFLPQQVAVVLPLYVDDNRVGRFIFALSLESLLAPLYQQHQDAVFMLLDQSGQLINSSLQQPMKSIDEHLLQIQRLSSMPWSIGQLEQKTNVFTSGLKELLWHWLSYALLLGVFLLVMQYRYRRRTLSPSSRLFVHIERLAQGRAQGVRRVPYGWNEVFDRVSDVRKTSE
ncbi:hypothetical protein ORJ00_07230 [Rheinheimera baltica]|uniref:cache domain-containing protein n=1 Tax=Rheinheimera baltica TaxID=67576 RepID=UPI00273D42C3|nr:hypothetical protein [Rheinheimera baltica]MDP5142530.1 hypothetical protein [Rheinheimera baltica]